MSLAEPARQNLTPVEDKQTNKQKRPHTVKTHDPTCGSYFGEVILPVQDHARFARPPVQDASGQRRQPEDHDDVDQRHEEGIVEVLARERRLSWTDLPRNRGAPTGSAPRLPSSAICCRR